MPKLDTKTFGECRTDPTLMRDCIREFLLEKGFSEEELPPPKIIDTIYTTFCATVAVRGQLPPHTKMRDVITQWDMMMMSYALLRAQKDVKAMEDAPRIIRSTH